MLSVRKLRLIEAGLGLAGVHAAAFCIWVTTTIFSHSTQLAVAQETLRGVQQNLTRLTDRVELAPRVPPQTQRAYR